MPNPGQANNPTGINDFSGPLGEREPEYGAIAREKALTSAAPGAPNPDSAGRRSQRRAVKGGRGVAAPPSPPFQHPQAAAMVDTAQQQQVFWQTVLGDPAASPDAKSMAQKALGG